MVFRKNGLLREITTTAEAIITKGSGVPGGIVDLQYAAYGGVFFALCHSGLCYGVVFPQRVSTGAIVFEPIDDLKVRIIDNLLQFNDIYVLPEPLTGLYLS